MLPFTAPYPFPGSTGFIVGCGTPVRILQRRADGRLTVAVPDACYPTERASGTRTLEQADLRPTLAEAVQPNPRPGRRCKAAGQ